LLQQQSKRSLLLLSTTVEPKVCTVKAKEITDPEFRQAMDAFHEVNEQVWELSRTLGGLKTISRLELNETFKPGVMEGWKRFRKNHPDSLGYIAISAIGFNGMHTVAVVYSEGRCGGKCGAGGLQYFRRTRKGWRKVNADFPRCDWIS
jgi:hypothetical protein